TQRRSAGSALGENRQSWKPFVYLAAMEAGYTPQTPVVDEPITIGNWSPKNYSGNYSGNMTVAQAVANSTNTVAVSIADKIG
ncbi:penicillin-binding transpeptidase domain-containing protein, partial [Mesorhizobium japonicum]|uniref:penicillin-binding transpeptidase domain-containing protein n=1 Tax=Mesorhizobium japonicum TaxID=2066070 RepID=UPI003B5AB4BF